MGLSLRAERSIIPDFDMHYRLLSNQKIQRKFYRAIRETVRPGDVVLDIGTGSGIHAIFACKAGARKVYAVEETAVIQLAKKIARDNGYSEKIHFICGRSQEIKLPEKADVAVTYVGFSKTLRNLQDARNRFLKKEGILIPSSVEFLFAPVTSGKVYKQTVDFWSRKKYGINWRSFRPFTANRPNNALFRRADFLSKPQRFPRIDFKTALSPRVGWKTRFRAGKTALLHGLACWPSFQLSKNVTLSSDTQQGSQKDPLPHIFLPLERPIKIRRGQNLRVEIAIYFDVKNLVDSVWEWSVEYNGQRFKQSSFKSLPLSKEILTKLANGS